ncbi:PilN domain-containing protein [Allofrancisella guangzhouensis]|uniref:Type IV pili associated protein n=1 Tax=Allofrancisella guangzhouensis TaxID=594679 RepID=A0A0A8E5B9_9GAMM|nr:PilN domain-containing protein [Allofrancisella guangzhouensis]AJC49129.1 type IV pili associated protein [Allofrancisella guangzhouensis]MBK2026846.1 PilN domain-containing protein [Allofrancisella guangzhouensis]MBK2043596.1 PilN domain-containing protein [Allofrancisella guangzhouensis]MBK2046343.1 PilN domain-containing protein [Allofrancisella guangzhouensis]
MKQLNFIQDRYKKLLLSYIAIDIGFIAVLAFIGMVSLSIILSWSSKEDIKLEQYIQAKITELDKNSVQYQEVKKQRDKLIDVADNLANIKASQFYMLLGIEKISRAITDKLYLTGITYIATEDEIVLNGETKDLKLLSVFMKNLEVEFKIKKVELKNLGSEKNGQRSFSLQFRFGEGNAFKGDFVQ